MTKTLQKLSLTVLLGAAVATTGCGGGGGGGSAPQAGAPAAQQPAARQASLSLSGVPDGAKVYVDGAPQAAGTTTLTLSEGVHEIVVARAGYEWTNAADFRAVTVKAGENLSKTVAFSRRRPPRLPVSLPLP